MQPVLATAKALTGGLDMVMTATPSFPTSMLTSAFDMTADNQGFRFWNQRRIRRREDDVDDNDNDPTLQITNRAAFPVCPWSVNLTVTTRLDKENLVDPTYLFGDMVFPKTVSFFPFLF